MQTAVLMILSMLYLMDYERIYKTQDLVLATTTGKKMMERKCLQERCAGCFMQDCLQCLPSWYFCSGSVSEPVACSGGGMYGCRAAAADDVSVCHVLVAGAVALSFACAGGACGTAWDRCGCYCCSAVVLQNSYFSFAVLGLLFMGAYLLAYVQMGNVWDLIRELFNPTVLYATSGGWFMENDLCLSFAGNEFAVLFCSGTAAVCLMAVGKRRYHRLEV